MQPLSRCAWPTNTLDTQYHDEEWGVPLYEDQRLFELLILEGVQAGLSWSTVLKRRAAYQELYDNFDPAVVATYTAQKIDDLLANPRLIRNTLKIRASVKNAQAFNRVQKEFGSFSNYLWRFVDKQPIINHWASSQQIPSQTKLSSRLSSDLKTKGFSFVGPTICYAFMQASGLVNDHLISCFRHSEVQ
ncbi:MAG: DNA-3-methyladenine glycosylase I [Cycloclasticus sp.]|nr:DNA-3-methyladenine glycosylase [Cycloclasticus sp. 46_120_T64]